MGKAHFLSRKLESRHQENIVISPELVRALFVKF